MHKLKSLIVALHAAVLTLLILVNGSQGQEKQPELNRKVLKFAEDHKGRKVGNGECWTLAAEALANAGAQRPGVGDVPIYVYGRKLGAKETIFPGDVAQFEKTTFVQKTKTMTFTVTLPKHTGIISKIEGKKVTMLQQNYAGKQTVEPLTISLDERTEGAVEIFRPVPKK